MVKQARKKVAKAKKVSAAAKQREKKQPATKGTEKFVIKKTLIGEVAGKYPVAVEVMFKYGMHCIGCGMTAYESIEQGCMAHGMSEQDIDKMVDEMNKEIAKAAKKK